MCYDLISFDLDGTLVDTAGEIADAANRALADHGIAPRPQAEITRLIGGGVRELTLKLLARCFLDDPVLAQRVRPENMLAAFDLHYAQTTGTRATPYPGCHESLARLRAAGLRLACVTNKESRHVERVLAATALERSFDLVIGGDTLPEKKPHASVLRHAAAALRVSPTRMVHLGDSAIDVEAARNAGVTGWVVPYGYNGGTPIAQAAPQRIFPDLAAVADHVLKCRDVEATAGVAA